MYFAACKDWVFHAANVMVLPTEVVIALVFAAGIAAWGIYDIWGHTQLRSIAPKPPDAAEPPRMSKTNNRPDTDASGDDGFTEESDVESLQTPGKTDPPETFPVSPVEVDHSGELHRRNNASSPYSTLANVTQIK